MLRLFAGMSLCLALLYPFLAFPSTTGHGVDFLAADARERLSVAHVNVFFAMAALPGWLLCALVLGSVGLWAIALHVLVSNDCTLLNTLLCGRGLKVSTITPSTPSTPGKPTGSCPFGFDSLDSTPREPGHADNEELELEAHDYTNRSSAPGSKAVHPPSPGYADRGPNYWVPAETPDFDEALLLRAVLEPQAAYIRGEPTQHVFERILEMLLQLTGSAYGFIGEVIVESPTSKFLRTRAITDISWNETTYNFYRTYFEDGLEFKNLETLFGRVITTGKTVISNNPSEDSRGAGIPEGHPPLNAFLGMPFYFQGELVGMVGIANRKIGYDEHLVSQLQPLLATVSNLIRQMRVDQRTDATERRKKMFWANLSHELRTPLQGIVTSSELACDEQEQLIATHESPEVRRLAANFLDHSSTILQSGSVLLSIVNNVLDFSKLEFSKMTVVPAPTNLFHVVEIVTSLTSVAARANCDLVAVHVDPSVPNMIETDPYLLQRVLVNLLSNAIKFTSNGSIRLSITTELVAPPSNDERDSPAYLGKEGAFASSKSRLIEVDEQRQGIKSPLFEESPISYDPIDETDADAAPDGPTSMLVVSVSDTGIGMDDKDQMLLFQPFTQADESHTRRYGGTGLGLATCAAVCKLLGGEISCTSKAGVGSTFTFRVPLKACDAAGAEASQLSLSQGGAPGLQDAAMIARTELVKRTEEIVLYERNEDIIQTIRWMAERLGLTLRVVKSEPELMKAIAPYLEKPQSNGHPRVLLCFGLSSEHTSADDLGAIEYTEQRERLVSLTQQYEALPIVHVSWRTHSEQTDPSSTYELRVPISFRAFVSCMASSIQRVLDGKLLSAVVSPAPKTRRLPLLESIDEADASEHDDDDSSDCEAASIKCLIVDDNGINVKVLKRVLKRTGFVDITSASDGTQAVQLCTEQHFDLVMMDLQMPDCNGLDATRAIRKLPKYANALPSERPFICGNTASLHEETHSECINAGMDMAVAKPVRLRTIADILAVHKSVSAP